MAADKQRKVSDFLEHSLLMKPAPVPLDADVVSAEDRAAVLSGIPIECVELLPKSRIVMITDPRSPGADRIRHLRMRLHELRNKSELRSIAVTSALPDDGKSTIALNLATALAESGRRSVLLIEGDLHQPALAKALNIQPRIGLAECLENGADPLLSLRLIDPLRIFILQAGSASSNPTELMQSDAIPQLLKKLLPFFDWILIDTPPIAPLTDAIAVSRVVDGTLLVVRAGATPKEVVADSVESIGPRHLLGVVLNAAEGLNKTYSKYTKYYGRR